MGLFPGVYRDHFLWPGYHLDLLLGGQHIQHDVRQADFIAGMENDTRPFVFGESLSFDGNAIRPGLNTNDGKIAVGIGNRPADRAGGVVLEDNVRVGDHCLRLIENDSSQRRWQTLTVGDFHGTHDREYQTKQ